MAKRKHTATDTDYDGAKRRKQRKVAPWSANDIVAFLRDGKRKSVSVWVVGCRYRANRMWYVSRRVLHLQTTRVGARTYHALVTRARSLHGYSYDRRSYGPYYRTREDAERVARFEGIEEQRTRLIEARLQLRDEERAIRKWCKKCRVPVREVFGG